MDEESELICYNCKRKVAAPNFALHSAYCQRNIKICEECDEPVRRDAIKEHEEEYHISVICHLCKTSMKKWRLARHQEELCPKRPVICEFCEADFPVDEAKEHNDFCGSRTEKCSVCLKFVMLKDKEKHLELHVIEENSHKRNDTSEVHQNTKNEIISRRSEKEFKSNTISISTEKNKSAIRNELDFGSLEGAAAPVLEKSNSKEISDKYTVCHLCKENVLWDDYRQHLANCVPKNDFKKCMYCDEYVPPFALRDHSYETCGRKTKSNTLVSMSDSNAERTSPSDYRKAESSTRNRSVSGYGSYADHTEGEQAVCPYCEQLLPRDRMYEHIESCPQSFYKCDLCLEKVLVKDKITHLNTQCKMVLKEPTSFQIYECPLCGETLPEKEKFSHESFACKTLLHINEEHLFHARDAERDFGHNGAKPKHAKYSEIANLKVGKCTYCKTTLNENILLYHEKECIHKPIKCPDCCSTILLRDYEKHHCKSRKGVNGRGRKGTQEAEKSEPKSSWKQSFTNFFSSNNKSDEKPTLDEHQNDRNHFYAERMEIENAPAINNDEHLYYAQQAVMDEPKIPCEFCNKQFPASEVVLHTTGCNPVEVSLPKHISPERPRKSGAGSRQLKYDDNSATSSDNFFASSRETFSPSTKYKSIDKRLERSQTRPGQYLKYSFEKSSEYLTSHSVKSHSSSPPKSVWNNDSSDVEMKENDPNPNSKTMALNMLKNVQGQSRNFSYETRKRSADSDEEMSSMINFIEGTPTESIKVKEEKNSCTLDKYKIGSESHADEEYTISKTGRSHKEKEPSKTSYHCISNADENIMSENVAKETTKNPVFAHNKMQVSHHGNDEFEHLSKTDKYQYQKNIRMTDYSQPEAIDDKEKKQPSYNIPKTEFILDQSKKLELANFRFSGSKMNDGNKEYDVYYKTNALGFVTASEDEESKIRRPRKKNSDACQNNVFQSNSGYQDDSAVMTPQEKKYENRTENISSRMPEKAKEVIRSKYEYQDVIRHEEGTKSGIQYVSPSASEKSFEMLESKHMDQDDNAIEACQTGIAKIRIQDSSSIPEKPFEMSKSKYKYQDDEEDVGQSLRSKSKISDVSSAKPEISKEISRSKYMSQNDINTDATFSGMYERVKRETQELSETYKLLKSKYMHQYDGDDIQTSHEEKARSRHDDDHSSKLGNSREVLRSKYMYNNDDDIQMNQKGKPKSGQDDSFYEKAKEMSKSKCMYQGDTHDIHASQKEKNKSRLDDAPSSMHEISKEQSKHHTICPICRNMIRWIDYNVHVPSCASSCGKCARCGLEVPSGDLKDHFLVKCSKIRREVESVNETNKRSPRTYDEVVQSLTSSENVRERKSRFEARDKNDVMKASLSRDKTDFSESNKNFNASRAEQAFKIEPAMNSWNSSEGNTRKVINISKDSRERYLNESDKSPENITTEEYVKKWAKWRGKSTDV